MSEWSDAASVLVDESLSFFGTSAVYTPDGGTPVTITVAFYEARETISPGTTVVTARRSVDMRTADLLVPPERGDVLVIGVQAYRVLEVDATNPPRSSLYLRKTA